MGEGETGQKGMGDLADMEEKPEAGVYILENSLPPGGSISANLILGEKYVKGKRKRAKMPDKKEERGKKKEKGESER